MGNAALIEQLQKQILSLQGNLRPAGQPALPLGLGQLELAFPGGVFPRGAVHELISTQSETAACTSGFISLVLSKLMANGGPCLWVSTLPRRRLFPPALQAFGIAPDRVFFMDTAKPKHTLWALEEALKCQAVVAVVGEVTELTFSDSLRLQMAVEKSQVTGFIHRFRPASENNVACVSRWKVSPLPSVAPGGMPGLGFPRWRVQLLKRRNGPPCEWQLQWSPSALTYLDAATAHSGEGRQTG